jgi:hypothetical protein
MNERAEQEQEQLANAAGDAGQSETKKTQSQPTRYRILWGRMPDPEDEEGRVLYREVRNPEEKDGAYISTSAETARRKAFLDESTDQFPHIQQALKQHGVRMRHVALSSWGDDDPEAVLKIETREDLTGKV